MIDASTPAITVTVSYVESLTIQQDTQPDTTYHDVLQINLNNCIATVFHDLLLSEAHTNNAGITTKDILLSSDDTLYLFSSDRLPFEHLRSALTTFSERGEHIHLQFTGDFPKPKSSENCTIL